jgi:hypothetical protein
MYKNRTIISELSLILLTGVQIITIKPFSRQRQTENQVGKHAWHGASQKNMTRSFLKTGRNEDHKRFASKCRQEPENLL